MKTFKEQTQKSKKTQEKRTGKHKTIRNPWYKYQLKNT